MILAFGVFAQGTLWKTYYWIEGSLRFSLEAQIVLWSIGGVLVLALAITDVWIQRDGLAWLLALWAFGTFVFTAFFNWTVNGRSILPLAPVVGILLARRLQQRAVANELKPGNAPGVFVALAVGALLAVFVARSDHLLAVAVRESANKTYDRYGRNGHTVWFQGHWGFQYYLDQLGGHEADLQRSTPAVGDVLAVPVNNTSLNYPPGPRQGFYTAGPGFLADQNMYSGAGFYSALAGPVPFAFGRIPPEFVVIYSLQSGPGP